MISFTLSIALLYISSVSLCLSAPLPAVPMILTLGHKLVNTDDILKLNARGCGTLTDDVSANDYLIMAGLDDFMIDYHPYYRGEQDEDSQTLVYLKGDGVWDERRREDFQKRIRDWCSHLLSSYPEAKRVVFTIAPGHSADSDGSTNLLYAILGDIITQYQPLESLMGGEFYAESKEYPKLLMVDQEINNNMKKPSLLQILGRLKVKWFLFLMTFGLQVLL